jgi:NADH:ubiquinone oxidoreductase subunit 2 (subunit N)
VWLGGRSFVAVVLFFFLNSAFLFYYYYRRLQIVFCTHTERRASQPASSHSLSFLRTLLFLMVALSLLSLLTVVPEIFFFHFLWRFKRLDDRRHMTTFFFCPGKIFFFLQGGSDKTSR